MSIGDLALLYNSRVKGKPKKLHTEWMGPYIGDEINADRSVGLKMLHGSVFQNLFNSERLKHKIFIFKWSFITNNKNWKKIKYYKNLRSNTKKIIQKWNVIGPWMNSEEGSSRLPFERYNYRYHRHDDYQPLHRHYHDLDTHRNK